MRQQIIKGRKCICMLKRDDEQIKDFKWENLNLDENVVLPWIGGAGDWVWCAQFFCSLRRVLRSS